MDQYPITFGQIIDDILGIRHRPEQSAPISSPSNEPTEPEEVDMAQFEIAESDWLLRRQAH